MAQTDWSDARIVELARGHIRVAVAGKTVTLYGEGYPAAPGGTADFEIYQRMLTAWDAPDDGSKLDEGEKSKILDVAVELLRERGMAGKVV